MADPRRLIPLLIIGLIFFTPTPNQQAARFEPQPPIEELLEQQETSLKALKDSSYGDIDRTNGQHLNLTGLEPERGFAWDALPRVKERAREQLQYALGDAGLVALEQGGHAEGLPALYSNVSGYVQGTWVRSELQGSVPAPVLNLTAYSPVGPFGRLQISTFGRNVTGDSGDLRMRFHERTPYDMDAFTGSANITGISAEMTMQDDSFSGQHDLELHGVYDIRLGQAILTTTSMDKMAGIFMLPQFALSNHTFEASRTMLNKSISRTIQQQKDVGIVQRNPWSSSQEGAETEPMEAPRCEMIMYLQQLPPSGAPVRMSLDFFERDLRFPSGAFLPAAPEMKFSMLSFSPDCGFVLESKGPPEYPASDAGHLVGPKAEVLFGHGRHHLLVFTAVIGGEIVLLMRQMRDASTPSTRSRISFFTIGMLALGDGYATMALLLVSLFVSMVWINLVGTAFLCFTAVSFFGMRFLMDVWNAQAPERLRQARAEAEEERQRLERLRGILEQLENERLARRAALNATATAAEGEQNGSATQDQQQSQPANNEAPLSAAGNGLQPSQAPPAAPSSITGLQAVPSTDDQPVVQSRTDTLGTAPTQPTSAPARSPVDMSVALGYPRGMPGSLPLPATAQRPTNTYNNNPIFMPSDQEGLTVQLPAAGEIVVEPQTSTFGAVYTRFYLILLASLFLSLNASQWPSVPRRVYFTVLATIYLSFWIPQIYRNVQRNCRRALRWEFVFGQSAFRLLPFAYFYLYRDNVVFAEPDFYGMTFLTLWVWMQIVLLGSQEIIGPRWFIRNDWAPPAYDYHPVLRDDEEGATMPIGFAEATSTSAPTSPLQERRASLSTRRGSLGKEAKPGKGKRVFDCAICFQDLEVPVVEAGGQGDGSMGAGLLARRNYMVTPCRHIFHSACLEGWMKYRLQCPICREELPPL